MVKLRLKKVSYSFHPTGFNFQRHRLKYDQREVAFNSEPVAIAAVISVFFIWQVTINVLLGLDLIKGIWAVPTSSITLVQNLSGLHHSSWKSGPSPLPPTRAKCNTSLALLEPANLSVTLRVTNLQPKFKHFSQLASPFSDYKQDLLLLTEILKTILFWPALLEYIKIKCSESYSLAKERLLIFHFAKAQTFQGHLALFQWIPHHMSTSVQANK